MKTRALLPAITAALLLAGCDKTPPPDPDAAHKAAVAKLLQQVRDSLKDPDSARFRSLELHASESAVPWKALCGEVNAKNSFGGYVGFRRFVASDSSVMGVMVDVDSDRDLSRFPVTQDTFCAPATLKFTPAPTS